MENLAKQKKISLFRDTPDMVALNIPMSESEYYAKPEIARYLNGIFRNEEMLSPGDKFFKYGAKVNKTLQEIVLSAGVPKTNLNFFAFGLAIKNLTTGIGNIATLRLGKSITNFKTVKNLIAGNFTKADISFFKQAVDDGTLGRMAGEGIDIGKYIGSYKDTGRGFIEFFKSRNAKEVLGEGFNRLFNEKTFSSFLPRETTTLFRDTYKSAINKGLS